MFIVFICCLLAALPIYAEVIQDDDRLQFAHGLYARGLDDIATREYEAYLRDNPESPQADVIHYRLGECYRRRKDYPAAEREFRRVYTGFPDSEYRLRAGFRRAAIFMEVNQRESAIDLFRSLLGEELPADLAAASTYYLAETLWTTAQTNAAVKTFQQVVDTFPETEFHAFALLKLGEFYGETSGGTQNAIDFFTKAARDPSSPRTAAEAWFQLAELHFAQADFQQSSEAYLRLITEYPSDPRVGEARLQAGWAFHNAGLHAEALRRCAEALAEPAPERRPEWLYLKANCERQLMQNEAAVKTYSQLLADGSDTKFKAAAQYEKALTLFRMGKFTEAIAAAGQVNKRSDLMQDVLWLLAESYAALHNEAEAIQYYRLLIRDFPRSEVAAEAHYRLGFHLQSIGEHKEAARYFSIIPNDFPGNDLAAQALFASASCLADAGLDAEAARDWSRIVREHGDSLFVEEALFQKGMSEARLNRDDEAILSLNEMLKRFPESRFAADAHFWLGVLYREAGRLPDAEQELRAVVKLDQRSELTREARYHLATVLYELDRHAEAATLFSGLIDHPELSRKMSEALLEWLAEYTYAGGNYGQSIKAAELLKERDEPGWQQIGYGLLGRARLADGDVESAAAAFRSALERQAQTPLAAEAALRLGEILYGTQDFSQADQYFSQAARLAAGDELRAVRARAYAGLGHTARDTGDPDAAARYFLSVAILYDDPDLTPECLFRAAEAFDALQRDADRDSTLEELRQRYPDSEWLNSISTEQ